MSEKIRIAVTDDHPLMLEGIVHVLSSCDAIEIVGTGQSAQDAIELAQQHLPDVMIIDINMPGGGLNALSEIATNCPAVRTIALTVREDHDAISKALTLGARAYVLKGVSADDLLGIIRTVHEGGSFVSTALASKLIDDHESALKNPSVANTHLTPREEQIFRLLGQGMSNKEIGRALDLKEKTIKHYVTNVLQKLHVRNRVEAAILAAKRTDAED